MRRCTTRRNVEGIEVARERFPDVPQVAVFDTAFHHALPAHSYTYAVPRSWREEHRVRRYGFHGTSFAYVTRRSARLLGAAASRTSTSSCCTSATARVPPRSPVAAASTRPWASRPWRGS